MQKRILISIPEIYSTIEKILGKYDIPSRDSCLIAEEYIESELLGKTNQGFVIFKRTILDYLNEPRNQIQIKKKTASTALIDGGNNFGQVVAEKALDLAIKQADRNGSFIVGIKNSKTFIRLGRYVYKAALANKICLIFTFVNMPRCAPKGVGRPFFGTNPIAIGIPSKKNPFVLDMATSIVSANKYKNLLAQKITKVPFEIGFTKEGKKTDNPQRVDILASFGDYKGFGLMMAVDLIAGLMLGRKVGSRKANYKGDNSHIFIVIDPNFFSSLDFFKLHAERLIRQLKKNCVTSKIHIPGEDYSKKLKIGYKKGKLRISKEVWDEILNFMV